MGGWTRREEWLETAVNHRTKLLRMAVVFPVERPPGQASVVEQGSKMATQLDRRHYSVDAEGSWLMLDPARHVYG